MEPPCIESLACWHGSSVLLKEGSIITSAIVPKRGLEVRPVAGERHSPDCVGETDNGRDGARDNVAEIMIKPSKTS